MTSLSSNIACAKTQYKMVQKSEDKCKPPAKPTEPVLD